MRHTEGEKNNSIRVSFPRAILLGFPRKLNPATTSQYSLRPKRFI
jgi:hypothetical protein